MGTPLKPLRLFTSAKTLSPSSPIFGKYLQNTAATPRKSPRQLFPANSPRLSEREEHCEPKKSCKAGKDTTQFIKLPLLIDTPNKSKMLKDGLQERKGSLILGKGGFGTVIKGMYKDSEVAVKITRKKYASGEKNATKISDHVNVMKTIDVITNQSGDYCLVIMEYLPGFFELQGALDDNNFEINRRTRLKYAEDICRGIDFCHKNDLLHLDLKPSNILLCKASGACKLCDFGNSRRIDQTYETFDYQGTVAYTSPEILLGKKPTAKSDVFSFGIIMWQLKFRAFPYGNIDNFETLVYKVVKTDLRPITLADEDFEEDYHDLHVRCWAKDPECRPEAEEILAAIKELVDVTQ